MNKEATKDQHFTTLEYSALAEAEPRGEVELVSEDTAAFELLCRFIRRQWARELSGGGALTEGRITAYERAYAYAQGVAEDRGIELPEIDEDE